MPIKKSLNKKLLISSVFLYSLISFSLNAHNEKGVKVQNLLVSDAYAYEESKILNLEDIKSQNLFGEKQTIVKSVANTQKLTQPKMVQNYNFILSGIFKGNNGESTAIIGVNNNPQKIYKEKSMIKDGVKLVKILEDSVIISSNGSEKIVKIF